MSKKVFNKGGNYPARTLFVGVDVAKHKHCARALNNVNNSDSRPLYFFNNRKGMEGLVGQISKWLCLYGCANVVVAMEPTAGYWEPMFAYLEAGGFDVRLVSSLKVNRSKDLRDNSPLKSDEKDALLIAELLRGGNVLDFKRGDDETEVKTLLKHIDDLEKTAGVYRNLVESFLSVHFPEFGDVFKDLGSPTVRRLLAEFPFPADVVAAGFEQIEKFLWALSRGRIDSPKARRFFDSAVQSIGVKERDQAVRAKIADVLKILETVELSLGMAKSLLEKKLESMPVYGILSSVKSVGVMTSASMLASLGDLREYRSCRQVLKKVGLNLYRFSSGKHRGADRISRRGMALLRKHLFMAALSNCRAGSIFYGKYKSMIDRGVARKKAVVAIMRKMLKLLFALVRDNRKFELNYELKRAKSDVSVIKQAAA